MKQIALFTFLLISITCVSQIKSNDRVYKVTKSFEYFRISPCTSPLDTDQIEFEHPVEVQLYSISTCGKNKGKLLKESFYYVKVDGKFYTISSNEIDFNFSHEEICKGFEKFSDVDALAFESNATQFDKEFFIHYNEEIERLAQLEQERLLAERERLEIIRAEKKARESDSIRLLQQTQGMLTMDSVERSILDNLIKIRENAEQILSEVISQYGGLAILDFVVGDNYGATTLDFTIVNLSSKDMKYIDFYVQAINPVDDVVGSIEKLRGIGYIESNEKGSWSFDDVWYDNTISSVRIESILITYRDGTTKKLLKFKRLDNLSAASQDLMIDQPELFTYEIIGAIGVEKHTQLVKILALRFKDLDYSLDGFVAISEFELNDFTFEITECLRSISLNESYYGKYIAVSKYSRLIELKEEMASTYITEDQAKELMQIAKEFFDSE